MADNDNELRVRIVADAGALKSALDEAAQQVKTASSEITESMQQAQTAAIELSKSESQLGPAVTQSVEQAKTSLTELTAAAQVAQAQMKSGTQIFGGTEISAPPDISSEYQRLAAAAVELRNAKQALSQTIKEFGDEAAAGDAGAINAVAEAYQWQTDAANSLSAAKQALLDVSSRESDVMLALDAANTVAGEGYQRLAVAELEAKTAKEARMAVEEQYASGVAQGEKEAVNAIALAREREIAATQQAIVIKRELTTALRQESIAEEEVAGATQHSTQAMYGAMSISRLMAGQVPTRAFERWLSSIEAVQKALMIGFQVAGIIAVGQIVYEMYTRFQEAADKAARLASEIRDGFASMNESIRQSTDDLALADSHIEQSINKLQNVPNNGLARALEDAVKSADKLHASLERDIQAENDLLDAKRTTFMAKLSDHADNKDTIDEIKAMNKELKEADAGYQAAIERSAEAGNTANVYKLMEERMIHLQSVYDKYLPKMRKQLDDFKEKQIISEKGFGPEQLENIELLQGAIEQAELKMKQLGHEYRNTLDKMKGDQTANARGEASKAAADENKRQEELIRKNKEGLVSFKTSLVQGITLPELGTGKPVHMEGFSERERGTDAEVEQGYWKSVVEGMKAAGEKGKALQQAQAELAKADLRVIEEHQKLIEENRKLNKEITDLTASSMQAVNAQLDLGAAFEKTETMADQVKAKLKADSEALLDWVKAVKEAREIARQGKLESGMQDIEEDRSRGRINDVQAAQRTTKLHTDDYVERRAEMQARYDDAGKDPNIIRRADRQAQIKNEMDKADQDYSVQHRKDIEKEKQAIAAPYIEASRMITNNLNQGLNSWLRGTQTFAKAMKQVWQGIAMDIVQHMEKVGEQWLETHVIMAAVDRWYAKTKKDNSDIGAKKQKEVASTQINRAEASSDAALAAAGAFAYYSAIDPPMAEGMAQAQYEQGMTWAGLACFDVGTAAVPNTGIALVHQGERIMTAAQNERITSAYERAVGGSGSGDFNLNHKTEINGITSDKALKQALNRNHDSVLSATRKALRKRGK